LNNLAHNYAAPVAFNPASGYPVMSKDERDLRHLDVTDRSAGFVMVADPAAGGPIGWVADHRDTIMRNVASLGWTLIRGLKVAQATTFRKCISQLNIPLVEEYGDLPMSPSDDGTSGVFNVTKYPSKNAILFHNEGSHTHQAPRFIFFQCTIAAQRDGETPLANSADVYQALPEEIRNGFEQRGLIYRRNFVEGLDVPWTKYFGTQSKAAVEELCAGHGIKTNWLANGGLLQPGLAPSSVLPRSGNSQGIARHVEGREFPARCRVRRRHNHPR